MTWVDELLLCIHAGTFCSLFGNEQDQADEEVSHCSSLS